MSPPSVVALVPARAGSKRVPGKNVRPLAGHPLVAYTIRAALDSGVFASVIVSTDAEECAAIARHYGAEVLLRPTELARDDSPDIEWLTHTLGALQNAGRVFDAFGILRPTSPFRQPATIRRAWEAFRAEPGVDSLRAVQRCREHPGKMWRVRGRRMTPLLPFDSDATPWHSRPYATLPEVHVQNASLELAWSRVVLDGGSIAGDVVMPFLTEAREGFDINDPQDWWLAERLIQTGEARLPEVDRPPPGANR